MENFLSFTTIEDFESLCMEIKILALPHDKLLQSLRNAFDLWGQKCAPDFLLLQLIYRSVRYSDSM